MNNKRRPVVNGYQPSGERGYQPHSSALDTTNPPGSPGDSNQDSSSGDGQGQGATDGSGGTQESTSGSES